MSKIKNFFKEISRCLKIFSYKIELNIYEYYLPSPPDTINCRCVAIKITDMTSTSSITIKADNEA